jgi:hypothetical protein
LQNKANVKMGKRTVSVATLKAYANEQRAMNNERYSKQTQSKPISNTETPYSARQPRDCRVPGGLTMTYHAGVRECGPMGGSKILAGSSQPGLEWLYYTFGSRRGLLRGAMRRQERQFAQ